MKKFSLYLFLLVTYSLPCSALSCSSPYSCKREQPTHVGIETYLQTLQGEGVGYEAGYSSIAFQISPPGSKEGACTYFIDARAHYFNDNKWAANLGFALRRFSESRDCVYGINAFYDFRQIHDEYHQVGVGLEMMSKLLEIRVNGYLPIAYTSFFSRRHTFDYPGGYILSCQGFRRALPGADAELLSSLVKFFPCSTLDPYLGVGPYYYSQKNSGGDLWGAKARLGITFNDKVTLEARASYDKVYGTLVQGFISFNFSFGKQPTSCGINACCDSWWESAILQPIERQEIIVDSKRCCCWKANY